MTFEEMKNLSEKEQKKLFHEIEDKRNKAKTTNFACVYGAGPPKISLTTGMPIEQATILHATYWKRNKAVKLVAKSCITKNITFEDNKQSWLFNPVSKFWYSLRADKDSFSTLNQGTGVFCFDCFIRQVRLRGIKIMLQYHDEIAFPLLKGEEENTRKALNDSIQAVNEQIKLNVPLGISVDFGNRYSSIH